MIPFVSAVPLNDSIYGDVEHNSNLMLFHSYFDFDEEVLKLIREEK